MTVRAIQLPGIGNAQAITGSHDRDLDASRLTGGDIAGNEAERIGNVPSKPSTVGALAIQAAGVAGIGLGVATSVRMGLKGSFSGGGALAALASAGIGALLVYDGARLADGDPTTPGVGGLASKWTGPIAIGAVGALVAATSANRFRGAGTFGKIDAAIGVALGAAMIGDAWASRTFARKYAESGTAGNVIGGSDKPLAAAGSDHTNPPQSAAGATQASMARDPAVQKAVASTVRIFNDHYGPMLAGVGSGWTAAPDTIVTNAHVVANSNELTVRTQDGRELHGTVVRFDPKADLAVVHVDHLGLTPLALDDTVTQDELAATIGYPNDHFFVAGATARETIDITNSAGTRRVLELDGDIDHGNSGGPIVNGSGEVIGTVFSGQPHVFVLGLPNDMVRAELDAARGKTEAVETRVPYGA